VDLQWGVGGKSGIWGRKTHMRQVSGAMGEGGTGPATEGGLASGPLESAHGYGENYPKFPNGSEEQMVLDRRVLVVRVK
jgi:hypothetical protein